MHLSLRIDLRTDADGVFFAATCPAFDAFLQGFGGLPQSDLGDQPFVFYTRRKARVEAEAAAMIFAALAVRVRTQGRLPPDTNFFLTVEWTDAARAADESF